MGEVDASYPPLEWSGRPEIMEDEIPGSGRKGVFKLKPYGEGGYEAFITRPITGTIEEDKRTDDSKVDQEVIGNAIREACRRNPGPDGRNPSLNGSAAADLVYTELRLKD